jgi:GTP diphosphokinase / guanosine-3',5'-bis(diphosphate) 3'-diphosphatase
MNDIKEITSLLKSADPGDLNLIEKAYKFARKAHEGHLRNNNEPYFNHLFETAKSLAELDMGAVTIVAGFLHDAIEDTETTREEIEREFGKEVLFLVEGVTKLGKLRYQGMERYKESLRKLFLAMSQDLRVLIIKLCDRLHNIKTLQFVPKEKQIRIAKETLEIYAPLAYRLGIKKLQRDLEDISFAYVYPKEYEEIKKILKKKKSEIESHLDNFQN